MTKLIMDGVKYSLWTPKTEDEFEQLVKEHANDIFGEHSIYFDIKKTLKSQSGIGSIPDAYVIQIEEPYIWRIVEVELSAHPLFEHIVSQVSKFLSGIKNPYSQRQIAEAIWEEIARDDFLRVRIRKAIGSAEIHKYLSDILATEPILTIIIEKKTADLEEALKVLTCRQKQVVEFQTFTREGVGLAVHGHLFEPLFKHTEIAPPPPPEPGTKTLEITLSSPSCLKFHLFYVLKERRAFFPGYKVPFTLQTDIGTIETWVSSAPEGTQKGDPRAGVYIQGNLSSWFKAHPDLKVGSKIVVTAVEPMKRYQLRILSITPRQT